ncbi:hypothetical protein [Providencia alcalifaciens]|uniref:hypothetical protein n=1 Tax=Providencia alcalifaciens TaxID=126385 RepID=UPI00045109FC|nr:hypothetical protein [Providencia alcalifaciens]EUC95748.1 hypothetical protein HMPREF1567_2478 [Providencia alcalifaciens PAL-2]
MEFKGTPAPWIISDSGNEIMDSEQFIFADVRLHSILCRWHEKGFEHWDDEGASKDIGVETKQANANLIAAAPELLSELIRLRNIVASYKQDSGDNLDITDAAIAKALGQQ